MTAVQHAATLDEPTVQRVARNELDELSARRGRAPETRPRTTRAVTRVNVNERVMQLAQLIVRSNVHGYRSIEIVDSSTVIVR